ncbi:MAG: class I SAM-dependent methyltransferase [Alphaproteobacteria bacterium]|nr:class I SAM-dependent methyltransferase [Alphaproteobacteria bacterium]
MSGAERSALLKAYLDGPYRTTPGMSSLFAARIATHLLKFQASIGVSGQVFEIGTYKGRFFAALALALEEGEKAIGIDHFQCPDETTWDAFLATCRIAGMPADAMAGVKCDSRTWPRAEFDRLLEGKLVRFAHVDGEHTVEHLENDLELALSRLHPAGLLCLDDMLHPAYLRLPLIVDAFLKRHLELLVCCVIDREDIVAAPKFLICREAHFQTYEDTLAQAFSGNLFVLRAEFQQSRWPIILTPEPKLAIL